MSGGSPGKRRRRREGEMGAERGGEDRRGGVEGMEGAEERVGSGGELMPRFATLHGGWGGWRREER